MKTTAYIATSLDGFIARLDGGIDWLDTAGEVVGEDYGYKAFMDTVDAIVMGRNTYEKVLSFGEWPYSGKPVVVLSTRSLRIPKSIAQSVENMTCSPADLIQRLSERGVAHVYVDGGKTIQGFLNAGLMQNLIITRVPVLIGSGVPLFGPVAHDIRLLHIQTKYFPNGLVQSEYNVLP